MWYSGSRQPGRLLAALRQLRWAGGLPTRDPRFAAVGDADLQFFEGVLSPAGVVTDPHELQPYNRCACRGGQCCGLAELARQWLSSGSATTWATAPPPPPPPAACAAACLPRPCCPPKSLPCQRLDGKVRGRLAGGAQAEDHRAGGRAAAALQRASARGRAAGERRPLCCCCGLAQPCFYRSRRTPGLLACVPVPASLLLTRAACLPARRRAATRAWWAARCLCLTRL